MSPTIRCLTGAAAVLVAGATLAQPPAAADYFPFKDKAKWAYKSGNQEVTVEYAGPKKFGCQDCHELVTKIGGKQQAVELYSVEKDGVYRVAVNNNAVVPPIKIIPIPARRGDSWNVDSRVGSQVMKGTFTVIDDKANVKVPAGEFDAVLVECPDYDVEKTRWTVKQWFAPGKGLVKQSLTIKETGTGLVLELKQLSDGK
jgi:hypothetical protein